MSRDERTMLRRSRHGLVAILFLLLCTSCAGVDTVRFTSEKFPPKKSVRDVEILNEMPSRPHVRLAQFTVSESKKSLGILQKEIMEKAAEVGADAVIFMAPERSVRTQVTYAPVYRPWGYYSPSYGWYGGGYYGSVPMGYTVKRNSLTGVAIKFTDR